MNIEDIKIARDEAKKFLEFTDDFLKVMDGHAWGTPAERGLVRAQCSCESRRKPQIDHLDKPPMNSDYR